MSDKREHLRTALKAKVKLFLEDGNEAVMTIRDVSNGGVFVLAEGVEIPSIGSTVRVQVQGMMEDAPVVTATVVRADSEGFGLKFHE